jgi:hypothetical protein
MSQENRFGIDGKAYYGAPGSTPATALDEAAKVSLKITMSEGEFNSRASAWGLTDVAMLKPELEITIKNSVRNATAIAFFWTKAVTRAAAAVKVLDAATGSRGIDADWMVTSLTNDQDLETPQDWVFSLKPTYTTGGRYPQAVTA